MKEDERSESGMKVEVQGSLLRLKSGSEPPKEPQEHHIAARSELPRYGMARWYYS